MSLIQMQGSGSADRQPSPGFSSNNPFRNRTTSPPGSHPQSPMVNAFNNIPNTAPERPTSRNPFLDQSEKKDQPSVSVRPTSPWKESSNMAGRASPPKSAMTGHTVELFDNLSLNNGPSNEGKTRTEAYNFNGPRRPMRSENQPPQRFGLSGHHPSRSQEDPGKVRGGMMKPRRGAEELDIFADPPTEGRPRPRPRRNSDSSIASKNIGPEDERRRRERHRREREARHRGDGKHRPSGSKSKKPNQRLDIIDSLDVSSIYGKGLFHHDGPFDACNPDRNRKGSRRAPMEAFAKDSKNNALGGSGPLHQNINFDQFHGRQKEGFTDYSTSGSANPIATEPVGFEPYAGGMGARPGLHEGSDRQSTFNGTGRAPVVHGEESLGLGTSTFLEGTPAARAVIQRRESESDQISGSNEASAGAGGLGRKRSLAQKIRGISNSTRGERGFRPANQRVTSPDGGAIRPTTSGEVQSAGGMPRIQEGGGGNPFFKDFSSSNGDAYDKKGQHIQIAEDKNTRRGSIGGGEEAFNADASAARHRAVSRPERGDVAGNSGISGNGKGVLERRVTNDGTGVGVGGAGVGSGVRESDKADNAGEKMGFLNRVKSLKGGKRSRPERRE